MNSVGACNNISKEIKIDFLVLKHMEGLAGGSVTGLLFASVEDEFKTRDTLEDIAISREELDPSTPKRSSNAGSNWVPESAPTPHCFKIMRNLGMLPVRKSLVGSFEESLL